MAKLFTFRVPYRWTAGKIPVPITLVHSADRVEEPLSDQDERRTRAVRRAWLRVLVDTVDNS